MIRDFYYPFLSGHQMGALTRKIIKRTVFEVIRDDFLKSELTDLLYDSASKNQLSNEEEQD